MAYERGLVDRERAGAEDMIGVHVRHEHVSNRTFRDAANVTPEPLPVRETAAGVDDGDGRAAYHESYVGNGVQIVRRSIFVDTATHVNAGGDLRRRKRLELSRTKQRRRAAQTQSADDCFTAREWSR